VNSSKSILTKLNGCASCTGTLRVPSGNISQVTWKCLLINTLFLVYEDMLVVLSMLLLALLALLALDAEFFVVFRDCAVSISLKNETMSSFASSRGTE
jgi:hypothetical protein